MEADSGGFAARRVSVCEAFPAKRLKAGHFRDRSIDESPELTRMMGASVATARRKLEREGDKEN